MLRSHLFALALVGLASLAGTAIVGEAVAQAAEPGPVSGAAEDSGELRGVVLETMDSGGYTYALLDLGGSQIWVAGPLIQLEVGSVVTASPGSLMADFFSRGLGKTFDKIRFVGRLEIDGQESVRVAHAEADRETPVQVVAVQPLKGGHTVVQVHERAQALAGQEVGVRGTVVKVSNGILGSNWLHLQDGTGLASAGTNDLVVTTQQEVERGAVVVVRGTVGTDREFGLGYRYAVLVENARVEQQ